VSVPEEELAALREAADAKLASLGASRDEIDQARASGTLGLLAVAYSAIPSEARYTPAELSDEVGISRDVAERFWRALGFADVAEDERAFTAEDADALSTANALIELGFSSTEVALQMSRVLGSSLARIAEAMVSVEPASPEADAADELFALTTEAHLATQARLVEYVWRRHLRAAARRHLLAPARVGGREPGTVELSVGFADLVGFTALSQQLDQQELATIVGRFEELAFDQVTMHGGRVAKMIGDEVMFIVEDPTAALETALSLAEAYADDEVLSDVRVGLAAGDVLARDGDYYGPVVNLASRVVNIAVPGAVVVSESIHTALSPNPRFVFHALRPRSLKDIGRVRLWRARRGHPAVG